MTDEEKRLRDAFLAITVPKGLTEKTLQYIEAQRPVALPKEAQEAQEVQQQSNASITVQVLPAAMRVTSSKASDTKPHVKVRPGGKFRVVAALVACFCLAFAGMGGYAYATPSAYVSVEAPVGMALKVNCFDIVVGVESFNGTDLQELAVPVDVVGKSYAEALNAIAQANQTFNAEQNSSERAAIDISITSSNEQQMQNLQQESEHCMNAHGMHGHCQLATTEEHEAALAAGMGVARYLVAQELMALDSSVSLDDCRDMTMMELRERIVACGGETTSLDADDNCNLTETGDGCSAGGGSGHSAGHGTGNGGSGKGNGAGMHGRHTS